MNKYQKNNILSIIISMERAEKVIKGCILQNNTSDLQTILIECQNAAIEVGNIVERTEGEACKIVHMLEEYCEILYQISIEEKNRQLQLTEEGRKQLLAIGNCIRREIITKREVVFMPYKAEMWDSMESIWIAAKEDEECECHVVVLPYYVKNERGELEDFCYEGSEFPKEVSVEHYTQYELSERHPDVIVIHNAYDDGNYITSIHPNYYSTELKKYTDMLVYIPYFVSLHNVGKHYCTLSGILMADVVFVQSEIVRKTYIEEYDKMLKEYSLDEDLPAGKFKFIALGSPKFDKVRSIRKEMVEIPSEWSTLLEQKDKRVVLYNTHLSGVMQTRCETFFENLESELEIFKKNKEIILLWRPHPLTESTAKSMNPNAAKKYRSIVEKYKEEQWGIFDDTADLYRAITLADAYYGDVSSLVPLFFLTGKPTMINRSNVKLWDGDIEDEYCISDDKTCGQKMWEYIQRNM